MKQDPLTNGKSPALDALARKFLWTFYNEKKSFTIKPQIPISNDGITQTDLVATIGNFTLTMQRFERKAQDSKDVNYRVRFDNGYEQELDLLTSCRYNNKSRDQTDMFWEINNLWTKFTE